MNIAIIFAGGVGKRMNSKVKPKQFITIQGKPIIIQTLEKFDKHKDIDAIVVACVSDWIDYLKELIAQYHINKVRKIVPGGKTGQLSIYQGLKAAKEIAQTEKSIVLVHDGVRPMITEKLISDNICMVKERGSAITCVKVNETVLEVKDDSEIIDIPTRENSRLARAPQSFWLDDILKAHEKAISEEKYDFIDSCSMMRYYGNDLYLIEGPRDNIKITTPEDFYIMRALLDAKENSQIYGVENDE